MTLNEAVKILSDAGISSALYDARELFRHFAHSDEGELVLRTASSDCPALTDAVMRRARREPLQYIIGSVCFYREEYFLSPHCLIPRSDTEILVDCAIKNMPEGASFLDLCTGSGCVAISVLKNTVGTTAVAVDISAGALEMAQKNARHNGVDGRLTLTERDALSGVIDGKFDAILSNPPYVTSRAYEGLEPEIYYEPKAAFVGGEDGGDFYRYITKNYRDSLKDGGFIAYEIGYDQAEMLLQIAKEAGMSCQIIKDLSGNDRVALLRQKRKQC